MAKVFGIVGWKNSGKTTLVAALVTELTRRGHKVSTVKHASHAYTLDAPGSDTAKHAAHGAHEVAIAAKGRWAVMHEGGDAPDLTAMLARLSPCDFVLVEGFKGEPIPKVQITRAEARETTPLWPDNPTIKAVVADHPVDTTLPVFALDATGDIADLVMAEAV